MRKILLLLFPLALVLLFFSCKTTGDQSGSRDTTYTVSFSVKGLDSGLYMLFYTSEGKRKSDSVKIVNGQGTIKGSVPMPVRAYLQRIFPTGYDMLPFYLENGSIAVVGALDSMNIASVSGTATNELNQELQEMLAPVKSAEEALNKRIESPASGQALTQDSIFASYNKIDNLRKTITTRFISKYPASVVSANEVIEMFIYNPDVKKFDSVVNMLDSSLLNTTTGKEILSRLAIAKSTDIGQIAPNFTQNDVNGNPVEVSSLFGKYLLIDFWASWCGPCRQDNPNLVKTYRDYHKKGFDIVSISLDSEKDRDKWLEAIRKDQLTWLQLSDLKGWENAAARLYGINGIPMNYLLDPDGRIIAKGLRGDDLRKKMEMLIR